MEDSLTYPDKDKVRIHKELDDSNPFGKVLLYSLMAIITTIVLWFYFPYVETYVFAIVVMIELSIIQFALRGDKIDNENAGKAQSNLHWKRIIRR
jgi:hypothetical protein